MERTDEFLEELDLKRKETQKQFDRLVIKRFYEMVCESSEPEQFRGLEKDIRLLKKTRDIK